MNNSIEEEKKMSREDIIKNNKKTYTKMKRNKIKGGVHKYKTKGKNSTTDITKTKITNEQT